MPPTIFNGDIRITLTAELIDSVAHESDQDYYYITVRFRDGVILKLTTHHESEHVIATFSSVAIEISMPIDDEMYDELIDILERRGFYNPTSWGL
jgi:hypothetical protein